MLVKHLGIFVDPWRVLPAYLTPGEIRPGAVRNDGIIEVKENGLWEFRHNNQRRVIGRIDLLLLVRIHKLLQKPATEVQQYYLTKLGKTAAQQTDKDNGEITITIGEKEHFRLVVITPNKDGCDLLLERVQQFTPPSRIYTATEQQAIRVIKNVAATYRTAQRISYDMIDRTERST